METNLEITGRWMVNNYVVLEQKFDAAIGWQIVWRVPARIFETHLHPTPEENYAVFELQIQERKSDAPIEEAIEMNGGN